MTILQMTSLQPAEPNHQNFIFSSWLRSYRNSDITRFVPNEVYYEKHSELVTKLLDTSTVLMAVNADCPDQIFGFICYDETAIHYVYVKYIYRKMGLAKLLLEQALHTTVVTHLPPKLSPTFTYNPYLLELK